MPESKEHVCEVKAWFSSPENRKNVSSMAALPGLQSSASSVMD